MVACGQGVEISAIQANEEQQPPGCGRPIMPSFSTFEEFLYAHRAVIEGRARGDLVRMAEDADFASLTELLLPSNLPENYQIDFMEVNPTWVWVNILPEIALVSERTRESAISSGRYFTFGMTRWDSETPMVGIMQQFSFTERDLVEGVFLYERSGSSTLYWAVGRELLSLRIPRMGYEDYNIHDLLQFTETTIIDLTDKAKVAELLIELSQASID